MFIPLLDAVVEPVSLYGLRSIICPQRAFAAEGSFTFTSTRQLNHNNNDL
jgi:hypothetical protein